MKILIADGKILKEKIINENNKKIFFEYNDYLDFFSFDYIDNKIIFNKNDSYYEVLSNLKSNILDEYSKILIKSKIDNSKYKIYILPEYDSNYKKLEIKTNVITIGNNNINMSNIILTDKESSLFKININLNDDNIILENKDSYDIYINNVLKENINIYIKYGDLIFIDGIIFSIISNYIYIYNSNNNISIDKNCFNEEVIESIDINEYSIIKYINYNDNNPLNTSPVIKKKIIDKTVSIDPPSAVELKENNPLFLTMLPMVLMSSTTILMSLNILNNIKQGKTTWADNSISLIFSGVMIFTMILYPLIQNAYKKSKESKREIKRIEEYKDYIYEKKREIKEYMEEQKNILLNNYKDTESCYELINNNIEQIWDKKNGDDDFLSVSLGKGKIKPFININYPEEHFTIDRDKLRIQIVRLKEQVEYIENCPIILNLSHNNSFAFEGKKELLHNYIESFLIRLFCSHSYENIKVCVFTNKENKLYWSKYFNLRYFWDDEYSLRFFGYDSSSVSNVVNYLDNIYKERKIKLENNATYKIDVNYIIIIDNYKSINDIAFLNEILSTENNFGFTTIFITEHISNLPSYCKNFIKLNRNEGSLITKDNNYQEVKFIPDIYENDFIKIYEKLASLSIDSDQNKMLPKKITFLEMYKVDGLKKLNVVDKWNNNTTLDNMGVPIGVNEYGELIKLDLHENSHGPHGLIAGMTGSGKSELIISFILSLSINYSPKDIQFVLIDYKGGGLSNTFYNNEIGKRLPHIVGVITNISESEINRCLISLQSEIKRRQVLFSEASIKYNEGNIDIYKYQQLAKKNKDLEYLSHLIIISDEFAELKTQNPEFIDKLVSLARIGRSLGIHLILCTQKPSGIVDSQIWSNSKFKICLKVQDKSDSKEVIGVDDAVYLNVPGRFYLQIGYNEMFMKGQCAYSNAPYYIEEKSSVLNNFKIDFINESGKTYYSYSTFKPNANIISGTHVSNIVKYLIETSIEQKYPFKYLWKDSLEENIILEDLLQKYNYQKNIIPEIVFGEYDEVDNQRKDLAKYNLLNGNIVLYGLTGSGKSELIQTSLYFLTKYYTTEEINIYAMDFSLENLKMFADAPQIGDVMYLYESEKIINTFKLINSILIKRKDILANYSGSIEKYNKENEQKLPIIYIIISNLERLFENFPELENIFLDITRDCNKFGITFMVTISTLNGVRTKLLQGFKQVISLELKDKYDYDTVFGSKVKYAIPHILGRGFIKINNVYEMQTAKIINEENNIFEYIEKFCDSLNINNVNQAPNVPILPSVVSLDYIRPYLTNNLLIPVGVDVEELEVLKLDFTKKGGIILTSRDDDLLNNYTKCILKNISLFKKNKAFMFSPNNNIAIDNVTNISKDFGNYFEQLINFIDNSDKNIDYFIIFKSLSEILELIETNLKEKSLLYDLIDKINKFDNFHLLLIDLVQFIKRYEYNEFYTSNFNNSKGIYIGEGITEQFIIKISSIPRKYRETSGENFGYFIENNKLKYMKVLEYKDE